jgi:phosphatidylserine/phosphatidylglycerophosphate/cardiolipin synthase-like enzyme
MLARPDFASGRLELPNLLIHAVLRQPILIRYGKRGELMRHILILVGYCLLATLPLVTTAAAAEEPVGFIELVETYPIETDLDHSDLPEAHIVWLEMIAAAETSLDFAEFYASNEPGSRLEDIIIAVEAAAARGVTVRFLAEEKFYKTYPETLERLNRCDGIEMRRYDVSALMGGVLHAKYFLVDGKQAYIGSQNFDWRALTHIQELGIRIAELGTVTAIKDLFEADWRLAALTEPPADQAQRRQLMAPSVADYHFPAKTILRQGEVSVSILPVYSPREWCPVDSLWDLPRLVEMIDSAESTVRFQLLSYRTVGRDGSYFGELESALRRAAARKTEVEILLSHWSKRPGTIEGLQSLQAIPGITVKLMTIPEYSGGPIPYARVIHAKYLVVDGKRAWIGTSNWDHDYFYGSRNVGLIIEGVGIGERLDRYFLTGWTSDYSELVDPCGNYDG